MARTIINRVSLRGSILQAGTCKIFSLAENPRWSRVWQNYVCLFRDWDEIPPLVLLKHSLFVKFKEDSKKILNQEVKVDFFQKAANMMTIFIWDFSEKYQLVLLVLVLLLAVLMAVVVLVVMVVVVASVVPFSAHIAFVSSK